MFSDLMLILGVAVLSIALRSFYHPVLRKLGAFGVLCTSFVAGWKLSGYWQVGLFCASSWLLLPWLEILDLVRQHALEKWLPIASGDRHLADQRPIGDTDGLGCRLVLGDDVTVVLGQDEAARLLHDCALSAVKSLER